MNREAAIVRLKTLFGFRNISALGDLAIITTLALFELIIPRFSPRAGAREGFAGVGDGAWDVHDTVVAEISIASIFFTDLLCLRIGNVRGSVIACFHCSVLISVDCAITAGPFAFLWLAILGATPFLSASSLYSFLFLTSF